MDSPLFDRPIINSPYAYPIRYWELDASGQPTQRIIARRRRAEFITPIPSPKKQKGAPKQEAFLFDEGAGLTSAAQSYDHTAVINSVRQEVDRWRLDPDPNHWRVTLETARLLQHWRHHPFSGIRPFFCQIEAVETAIWLTEVAPQLGKAGERFLKHLSDATASPGPQTRHRGWQDHRHGHADHLADHQRRAPTWLQEVQARLSRRHFGMNLL